MDLSVIIVSWNTRDLLCKCLQSIYAHSPAAEFDVWVVDNASSDGTPAMVRERFPDVRLVEPAENIGFAAGNNLALRRAQGQYLLLLNSDAMLRPNTLEAMLAAARADPRIAAVGARSVNPDGTFQASYNDFPTLLWETLDLFGLSRWLRSPYFPSYPPEKSAQSRECDWVGGACMLINREAIQRIGVLDEGYFMYAEEMDWCYRMVQAGWKVHYCAEAIVVHVGGASAERLSARQRVLLYGSKTRFFVRHRGTRTGEVYGLAVRITSALKAGYWLGRALVGSNKAKSRGQARSHWAVCRARLR